MKAIIIDQKQIVKNYVASYFFFDIVALCHSFIINNTYSDVFISWKSVYSFLCFIPVLSYLVRLKTFLNVVKDLIQIHSAKKSFCVVAYHTFLLVFLIHTFTCSIYAIPLWIHEDDVPDGSLLQIVENRASSRSSLYMECCLLVICNFLGVDYSEDITVPEEQLCLFIMIFSGRIYTLFLIADLLGVFGFTGTSESEYERHLAQLNALMRSENLPIDLRKKLVNYYECKYMRHHFNEDDIFSDMDDFMRTEILLFSARKLLLRIEAFQLISRTQFVDLFMHKKSTIYLTNDVISKRGSTVDKIYFICYGTVAVLNAKDREIIHIKDGDHFGLISYWTSPDLQHIFSHVAVETCEIFSVSTKEMNEFFARNQEAKKYFENKVRQTIQLYKRLDESISRGGTDLLSELRGKLLFEVPKLRPIALD
ncbi:potassium/sodium hyperpolarization-activated cyclic nucleotide-gated channel 2-like [Leptinotarsa decemlineata]|uniref:potassium/sodium hyperpolarization-activated cyclic nucleotide-gated channel 2-like n=1 Tax=Leptinotarsa decemlineata TaxID=7539 RepID=UPI003D305DAB